MGLRVTARKHHLVALITGLLIGVLFLGTSYAVTSDSFTYRKPKTGYLSLGSMDFAPDSPLSSDDYFISWKGSVDTDTGTSCFQAGVHVPQFARIKSVSFTYVNGDTNFYVDLARQAPRTGGYARLVRYLPTTSGSRKTVTKSIPSTKQLVDNSKYTYGVGTCVGADDNLFGVRIKYTYETAGD
jgi:hypothetical protein